MISPTTPLRRLGAVVVGLLLSGTPPARAQTPGEPGAPLLSPRVTTSTSSDRTDAEGLLEEALETLARGDRTGALEKLRDLALAHPGYAASASEILRLLEAEPRRETRPGLGRDGPPTGLARAELVILQSLHGVGVGGEICAAASCEDARAIGASLLLGGGVGFGLSFFLTGSGMTPGHAASINSGTVWGLWNALAILGMIQPSREEQVLPASLAAGQLVGLGLGHFAWELTHASSGDVSLASSVGIWSGVLTLMIHAASKFEADDAAIWGSLLAASDLGLALGVYVADLVPMSRGHSLIIDGGGVLGLLLGMGVDLLIQGRDVEPLPLFTLASVGAVGGLGLTAYLTRDWDLEEAPVTGMLIPTDGGALFALGGSF